MLQLTGKAESRLRSRAFAFDIPTLLLVKRSEEMGAGELDVNVDAIRRHL